MTPVCQIDSNVPFIVSKKTSVTCEISTDAEEMLTLTGCNYYIITLCNVDQVYLWWLDESK